MLFLIAFIAGILTVFTPCVLPVLPFILGIGATSGTFKKLAILLGSFMISTILFTLAIHRTTSQFISLEILRNISLIIMVGYGITLIIPRLRDYITSLFRFSSLTHRLQHHTGYTKEVFLGMSLGPLFNTCSPTYAFILALILPQHLITGFISITIYVLGVGSMLGILAFTGLQGIKKINTPRFFHLPWKKILGVVLIIISVALYFHTDKILATWILNQGRYTTIEHHLVNTYLQP